MSPASISVRRVQGTPRRALHATDGDGRPIEKRRPRLRMAKPPPQSGKKSPAAQEQKRMMGLFTGVEETS